jgi:hypothetical protein
MELVHIYAQPTVAWQVRYANALRKAFTAFGYGVAVRTSARGGISGDALPVVLGPNYWQAIQADCARLGVNYVMVNRAFWGDPDFVSIGWNGFNGHADFVTDHADGSRWERIKPRDIAPLRPIDPNGRGMVFAQFHAHSTTYPSADAWAHEALNNVRVYWPHMHVEVRPHPAQARVCPLAQDLRVISLAVTLNSTVAVECLIDGVVTVAVDRGSPVYGCVPHSVIAATSYGFTDLVTDARRNCLHRLAWSQWSIDEIPEGQFWRQLSQRQPLVPPMPIFAA